MIKSKKFSLLVILFTLSVVCFLAFAGINGYFALAENSVELTISGQTLSLKDNIHIKYAVNADGVSDSDTLNLLVWENSQVDYTKGTENTILTATDEVEKNEQTLKVFEYNKLSAKQMTDKIYARAYAVVDGVEYYSQVKPYSILEYAYNKLDKTEATPTDDENLISLINAMLEFGGASQVYNNYALDRLANEDYAYVRIENAIFSDGFNYGIYKVGTTEIITPNDGYFLSDNHAEYISTDENGQIILTIPSEKTIDTASFEKEFTEGLVFESINNDTEYEVSGYTGTSTEVYMPSTYNCKPVTSIGEDAFRDCSSLTSITIPNSVTSIGSWAFRSCSSLTEVEIPDSVTSIGYEAFYKCSSLTSIIIPDSVTYIGLWAFNYCNSLTSTIVHENNIAYKSIDGNLYSKDGKALIQYAIGKTATSFTIPSTVTSIHSNAFNGCRSLETIEIPNSVTSIGYGAFWNCRSLETIEIPDSVTSINSCAFAGCSSLETIEIPNSVTYIGDSVFPIPGSLNSLLKYNEKDGLNYLGNENNKYLYLAGAVSTDITTATIDNNCKFIGSDAFCDCDSLTSIKIPNSVTSIRACAFWSCSSLTSIIIPDSVTSIGYGAFLTCSSLAIIYCEAESQPSAWHSDWNLDCNAEVVWGYKG